MTIEALELPDLDATLPEGTSGAAPVATVGEGRASKRSVPQWPRLVPLLRPTGYYVASRVAVLFAVLASKWLDPKVNPLRVLTTGWDGSWYRMIAEYGYPQRIFNEGGGSRWAFFPAYPALLRGTVQTTGLSYDQATIALSVVLGLTSTVALWLAIREIFGPTVADRSTLLYVFFPASYVLSMAYTEALFITAAGLCLFALSRKYWVTAALMAGLGSLTRSFGVVLVACVIVAAAPAVIRNRNPRALMAIFLSPIGFLAWLMYSWARVGTPLAFLNSERVWGDSHFVWFRTPFVALVATIEGGTRVWDEGQMVLASLGVIVAGVGIYFLIRASKSGVMIPAFWWIFTIGSVAGMLSPYKPVSILRYALPLIPLFAAFAWRIRKSWESAIVGSLAFSQGVLALVVFLGSLHPQSSFIWP